MCKDFANARIEGMESPGLSSPDMIAALIWDAICSYKGRFALLLTMISKISPQLYCVDKYSI